MNKEKPTALGFQRKPYAKPHIDVWILSVQIICTSGNSLTPYGGEEWEEWEEWEDN